MEEIFRETAMAYCNGGSEEQKQDTKKFFNFLDKDGDGILSMQELIDALNCDNEVFMKFDRDNNGTLDFQEFITLNYAAAVNCRSKFRHNHSVFMDNLSLLEKQRQSSLERDPMESLRKIATTYYNKGSEHVKQLVKEFFNSMDINGDGQISLHEFLSFMKEEGYSQMSNPFFFKVLDKDGNNILDFDEVLMLYYVMRSGRRFCEGCGCFLDGMYLTCVSCFETDAHSFCICFDCYCDNKYIHKHSNFLDNFALLEMKRQEALKAKKAPKSAPQCGQYECNLSGGCGIHVLFGVTVECIPKESE
ncbi:EF-hand domain [Dillenia turbinata]|uniref:EF-hand domain n=1 Tax=Dillenia turbinata TaxID=194707 RepID=A0AAN8UC59_9MAGN